MIGASPRPSVRVLIAAHVDAYSRVVLELVPPIGAGLLTLAVAPPILAFRLAVAALDALFSLAVLLVVWLCDDEADDRDVYGDGALAC